jgi:hypothetical protein
VKLRWSWPLAQKRLRDLAARFPHTRGIDTFLLRWSFPVDVRHNSKIFREKLAVWADKQLGPKWNPGSTKTEEKATA